MKLSKSALPFFISTTSSFALVNAFTFHHQQKGIATHRRTTTISYDETKKKKLSSSRGPFLKATNDDDNDIDQLFNTTSSAHFVTFVKEGKEDVQENIIHEEEVKSMDEIKEDIEEVNTLIHDKLREDLFNSQKTMNDITDKISEFVLGELLKPMFSEGLVKSIPEETIKGAAIAGATISILGGSKSLVLSTVVATAAAYLAITPGKGGETMRIIGNTVWKSGTDAITTLQESNVDKVLYSIVNKGTSQLSDIIKDKYDIDLPVFPEVQEEDTQTTKKKISSEKKVLSSTAQQTQEKGEKTTSSQDDTSIADVLSITEDAILQAEAELTRVNKNTLDEMWEGSFMEKEKKEEILTNDDDDDSAEALFMDSEEERAEAELLRKHVNQLDAVWEKSLEDLEEEEDMMDDSAAAEVLFMDSDEERAEAELIREHVNKQDVVWEKSLEELEEEIPMNEDSAAAVDSAMVEDKEEEEHLITEDDDLKQEEEEETLQFVSGEVDVDDDARITDIDDDGALPLDLSIPLDSNFIDELQKYSDDDITELSQEILAAQERDVMELSEKTSSEVEDNEMMTENAVDVDDDDTFEPNEDDLEELDEFLNAENEQEEEIMNDPKDHGSLSDFDSDFIDELQKYSEDDVTELSLEILAAQAREAVELYEEASDKATTTNYDDVETSLDELTMKEDHFDDNEQQQQQQDWSLLTVSELKAELKSRGLKVSSKKMKKADLIATLEQSDHELLKSTQQTVAIQEEEESTTVASLNTIEKMTVPQLREELRKRGLKVSGKKADLIKRIMSA